MVTYYTCQTCGKGLNTKSIYGIISAYHPQPDLQDHTPDPIPSEKMAPLANCDICSEEKPEWTLSTERFIIPACDYDGKYDYADDGEWAFCDTCRSIFVTQGRDNLEVRSLERWVSLNDTLPSPANVKATRLMWSYLYEAIQSKAEWSRESVDESAPAYLDREFIPKPVTEEHKRIVRELLEECS